MSKGIALTQLEDGGWRFSLSYGDTRIEVGEGESFAYEGRAEPRLQDWRKLPVSSISFRQAEAYVKWLDLSGTVPGAKICSEREWERAARGADGRYYPIGMSLAPGVANFDETYGKNLVALGPDEVGPYPVSASPFGVEDMAGNVWEWTVSSSQRDESVIRGGGFFRDPLSARSVNRSAFDPVLRDIVIGLRVCASYKSSGK